MLPADVEQTFRHARDSIWQAHREALAYELITPEDLRIIECSAQLGAVLKQLEEETTPPAVAAASVATEPAQEPQEQREPTQ